MSSFSRLAVLGAGIGACLLVAAAHAYKLSPKAPDSVNRVSDIDGSWFDTLKRYAVTRGLDAFGDPVHEEITNRIYGCDGDICRGAEGLRAPAAVLAGVRWNDDPPFRLGKGQGQDTDCKRGQTIRFQTQPGCWYQLFRDAEQLAAEGEDFGPSFALLYRSHFGDLQFLHAMAREDGIPPEETRQAILDWAEFNWRIMSEEHRQGMLLKDIDNATIHDRFGDKGWSVGTLYTLGSPSLRPYLRDVAFGSLLHLLQDSFAGGHAQRDTPLDSRTCSIGGNSISAPGLISEFHAYGLQDSELHAASDTRGAFVRHFQGEPDVVGIGRHLRRAYEQQKTWDEVAPFIACIFALSDSARESSAGEHYERIES